jgi:hypothetical protein
MIISHYSHFTMNYHLMEPGYRILNMGMSGAPMWIRMISGHITLMAAGR